MIGLALVFIDRHRPRAVAIDVMIPLSDAEDDFVAIVLVPDRHAIIEMGYVFEAFHRRSRRSLRPASERKRRPYFNFLPLMIDYL